MRKTLLTLAILAAIPGTGCAEGWSLELASGPFIFGHFMERTTATGTEVGTGSTKSRLSAATRTGAAADIERDLNDWLAIRLEGAWTQGPLRIKSASGDQGITIEDIARSGKGVHVPKPQNGHTTIGIRYRF